MKIKVEVNKDEQVEDNVEYLIRSIEHRFGIEAFADSDNTVEIELNTDFRNAGILLHWLEDGSEAAEAKVKKITVIQEI